MKKPSKRVPLSPEDAAISNVLMNRNRNKNFVDRAYNPKLYPQIDNKDGSYSTHRMAYDPGTARVYPTIVQLPGGNLQQLEEGDQAWEYADQTGEYIQAPTGKVAKMLAEEGYKRASNIPTYGSGGTVSKPKSMKKKNPLKKMSPGGEVSPLEESNINSFTGIGLNILKGIMDVATFNPDTTDMEQPIYNAKTAGQRFNPYGSGGKVDNTGVAPRRLPATKEELLNKSLPKQTLIKQGRKKSDTLVDAEESNYRLKKMDNTIRDVVVPVSDIATDIMQLGKYIPIPQAQAISRVGDIMGMAIDGAQAIKDATNGDVEGAAINSTSMLLPSVIGLGQAKRNSKYIPNNPFPRTSYIPLDKSYKGMEKSNLFLNRLGAVATGVETGVDAKQVKTNSMNKYAAGGIIPNIPVEVEGEEVAETPSGQTVEFQGPSHEGGGIPIALPQGTEVFSKRIKIDGETMADRKKKRESYASKFDKYLKDNPTNAIYKSGRKRVATQNQAEDAEDMQLQEYLSPIVQSTGATISINSRKGSVSMNKRGKNVKNRFGLDLMADGGEVGNKKGYVTEYDEYGNPIQVPMLDLTGEGEDENGNKKMTGEIGEVVKRASRILPTFKLPTDSRTPEQSVPSELSPTSISPWPQWIPPGALEPSKGSYYSGNGGFPTAVAKKAAQKPKFPFTAGDALSLGGDLLGTGLSLATTLQNRAGDTPNINPYKTFGKDALQTTEDAESLLKGTKKNNDDAIYLARNAMVGRNRNQSRGISTMRALDTVGDIATQKALGDSENAYLQNMGGLLQRKAVMQNQIDNMRMQGEYQRDQNDRLDRDAYYNNLSKDMSNIGGIISKLGRNLNSMKYYKDALGILPYTNKRGIGYTYDEYGNPILIADN